MNTGTCSVHSWNDGAEEGEMVHDFDLPFKKGSKYSEFSPRIYPLSSSQCLLFRARVYTCIVYILLMIIR